MSSDLHTHIYTYTCVHTHMHRCTSIAFSHNTQELKRNYQKIKKEVIFKRNISFKSTAQHMTLIKLSVYYSW